MTHDQRRALLIELLAELEALADADRAALNRREQTIALVAPLGSAAIDVRRGAASIVVRRGDVDDAASEWAACVGAMNDVLGPAHVDRDDVATWDVGDRVATIAVGGASVVVTVRD